ncbi:unnamed protein product, partial [Heterosigma akashiwo]
AGSRHQNVWYTFNGEHQKYPFLSKLPKREERSRRALERQNEKNQRIDLYMRQNYEKRARRFFREQRRRALQALRQDAATPLDLYAVEARLGEGDADRDGDQELVPARGGPHAPPPEPGRGARGQLACRRHG